MNPHTEYLMNIHEQINNYLASLPEQKRSDLEYLHQRIQRAFPEAKLWFLDGKDDNGKVVTNPNIGYGTQIITYANGTSKEFYQTGISANAKGISVYIMGIQDKKFLSETYGGAIGKASITGYCIRFRTLNDINIGTLEMAIRDGMNHSASR